MLSKQTKADGYKALYSEYMKVTIIVITVITQALSLCTSQAIQMLDFNPELFCVSGESDTHLQSSPIYTIFFSLMPFQYFSGSFNLGEKLVYLL